MWRGGGGGEMEWDAHSIGDNMGRCGGGEMGKGGNMG